MAESDRRFAGSIPAFYDRHLGPLIFQAYADDLAARVAALAPARLLETAAGTGIVTRAMVRACPYAAITASDLNQPMLDYAADQPGAGGVIWRQADAQSLPFAEASFDVVVCQFGAMFFPDRVAAYREARRVLSPGGRFLLGVWGDLAANDFARAVTDALAAHFPDDPPRFLARTPHGYAEIDTVRADLFAAGFAAVAVDTIEHRSTAPSPREAAVAYCHGTPLRSEIEARAPGSLDAATAAAEALLARRFGAGTIDGRIRAHVFTAAR